MDTPNSKILLVEDQDDMRMITSMMLRNMGFRRVVEAVDGKDALDALAQIESTDQLVLIIADWNMPKMNGFDLLVAVRSKESYKTVPFLMITAQNDREKIVSAIEAGVTDYIVKPFSAKVLEEKINRALGIKR
ncbi:MAG: response regulator [Deltaproteobacteria bacterium]|nr:response regulator [Deltaproteobacteria bacterium]